MEALEDFDPYVCPRCGALAAGQSLCGACGLDLDAQRDLPRRSEFTAPQPETDWATFGKREGTPASWWSRVVATILDGVAVSVAVALIAFVGLLVASAAGTNSVAAWIILAAYLAVLILYRPAMIAANHGQTLGHQALGIRVTNQNGDPTGFGRAFVRESVVKLLFGISGLLLLIDAIWPWWQREKRALHDLLVGTRVTYAKD